MNHMYFLTETASSLAGDDEHEVLCKVPRDVDAVDLEEFAFEGVLDVYLDGDFIYVVEVDCPAGCSLKVCLEVAVVQSPYASRTNDRSPLSQKVLFAKELSEELPFEWIVVVNREFTVVEVADREVNDAVVVPMASCGEASVMLRRVVVLVGRHDLDPNRVVAWKTVKVVHQRVTAFPSREAEDFANVFPAVLITDVRFEVVVLRGSRNQAAPWEQELTMLDGLQRSRVRVVSHE